MHTTAKFELVELDGPVAGGSRTVELPLVRTAHHGLSPRRWRCQWIDRYKEDSSSISTTRALKTTIVSTC